MRWRAILFFFLHLVSYSVTAQESVLFRNPSFEDIHGMGKVPIGWYYCGSALHTPPDIHHTDFPGASFNVEMPSADGKTYVGMVARADGSVEAIGQHLTSPLQAGQCYTFSFFAACSGRYTSRAPNSMRQVEYDQPLRLSIWGGDENCDTKELLGLSEVVGHPDWKRHVITIHPKSECTHLIFKALFVPPPVAYNGNLLLDGLSPVIPVNCESKSLDSGWEPLAINVPSFEWVSELKKYLARQGIKIETDRSGYLLAASYFADAQGYGRQGNLNLWNMVEAMKQYPDYRMLWMVAERNFDKRISLERQLNYALTQTGLPAEQYEILDYKKGKARRGEWLWDKRVNGFLLQIQKVK